MQSVAFCETMRVAEGVGVAHVEDAPVLAEAVALGVAEADEI